MTRAEKLHNGSAMATAMDGAMATRHFGRRNVDEMATEGATVTRCNSGDSNGRCDGNGRRDGNGRGDGDSDGDGGNGQHGATVMDCSMGT